MEEQRVARRGLRNWLRCNRHAWWSLCLIPILLFYFLPEQLVVSNYNATELAIDAQIPFVPFFVSKRYHSSSFRAIRNFLFRYFPKRNVKLPEPYGPGSHSYFERYLSFFLLVELCVDHEEQDHADFAEHADEEDQVEIAGGGAKGGKSEHQEAGKEQRG